MPIDASGLHFRGRARRFPSCPIWLICLGAKGATGEPRPVDDLLVCGFQVVVQPEARFDFTLLGTERVRFARPAGTSQVLGITPDTQSSGGGGIVLVGLHVALQWKARIGQLAAKGNRENCGNTRAKHHGAEVGES
jgi:hypothetical protein